MSKDYKKILEIANDTRKFEIERFWQRSLFFWGFITASFVAYAYFFNQHQKALIIANFGLIASLSWTLTNRGSKYWQENWEEHIKAIELKALNYPLFTKKYPPQKKGIWSALKYSPSRITIALSD